VLPAVIYLLVMSVYPLISSFYLSLNTYEMATRTFRFVGLENYLELARDPEFLVALRNSILFTVVGVSVELVLGLALALFVNRNLPLKGLVRTLLILPMMATPMVVALMWRFLLHADIGMVNFLLRQVGIRPVNWVGAAPTSLISLIVVDIWQWTPFMFLLLYAGLQALPVEVLEAARVDGAGFWSGLRMVILPLLGPIISVAILFRGIDAFRSFDTVFALTFGGPGRESALLSFLAYLDGFNFSRLGYASAIAYVMVAVIIIFTNAYRRVVFREEG